MTTHSSVLAWRIPGTAELVGCCLWGPTESDTTEATQQQQQQQSVCPQCRRPRFNPWVGKIPWRRKWQPTPVFLPGKIPGTEDPGRLQSMGPQRVRHDTTERLHLLSVGITVQSNQKVPVNKGKFLYSEECHFINVNKKKKEKITILQPLTK